MPKRCLHEHTHSVYTGVAHDTLTLTPSSCGRSLLLGLLVYVTPEPEQAPPVILCCHLVATLQIAALRRPWFFRGSICSVQFSSVQFSHSVVSNSLGPHGLQHVRLSCPLPTPRACSNLCPIASVRPSYHFILCCSLLQPSIFPSIRVFSSESVLRIRRPKYWSFSFNISPFNEYSGLTSFRTDFQFL